jgi:hypothetical protein
MDTAAEVTDVNTIVDTGCHPVCEGASVEGL